MQQLFIKSVTMIVIFCGILLYSCKKEKKTVTEAGTPNLPTVPYNYSRGDNNMATLGRVLFYDKHLSANNTVACGSCHIQAFGFSDVRQFSVGVADKLTRRNTPSISNRSEIFGLFWDLRSSSFTDLVLRPVTNHDEMGIIDLEKLPGKLKALGYYDKLFLNAYGSSDFSVSKIQAGLAAFLSDLELSGHTRFEEAQRSGLNNLNELETLGWQIYNSKGNCQTCHPTGRGWSIIANTGLDINYTDNGISNVPGGRTTAEGVFKAPSLINIELTAPYMHDGRFKTLEEVVEHYNSGVKNHKDLSWTLRDIKTDQNGNRVDMGPKRLNLDPIEKKALVAFLKTLTDWDYVKDVRYSDPFVN